MKSIGKLLLIALQGAPLLVHAENALERQIAAAPLPHTQLTGGKTITVQMVSLLGQLDGKPSNADTLDRIKIGLSKCAADHRAQQLPVKKQTEWPDYLIGEREVTYVAKNYAISYFSSWSHSPNAQDCSLSGNSTEGAKLRSAAGICHIDLRAKTFKGQCDWERHRNASSPVAPAQTKQQKASVPAQQLAAFKHVLPQATGIEKTIAGIKCHVEQFMGESLCIVNTDNTPPFEKLLLERSSAQGLMMKATNANLNLSISEQVFRPHLAAGFTDLGQSNRGK